MTHGVQLADDDVQCSILQIPYSYRVLKPALDGIPTVMTECFQLTHLNDQMIFVVQTKTSEKLNCMCSYDKDIYLYLRYTISENYTAITKQL